VGKGSQYLKSERGNVMEDKVITFIVKANVSAIAKAEGTTEDVVIDTLTQAFTEATSGFGTECWLDETLDGDIDDYCYCNCEEDNGNGVCNNCNKKIR
jgi:hypothetical protein